MRNVSWFSNDDRQRFTHGMNNRTVTENRQAANNCHNSTPWNAARQKTHEISAESPKVPGGKDDTPIRRFQKRIETGEVRRFGLACR
jgi:hypothetical protein